MSGRTNTRTWHAETAVATATIERVADPAVRAVFRALSRALGMGLETERARTLIKTTIAERCGPWGDEEEPP